MPISLDKINNALDRLDNKGGSSNQNQDALVKLDEGEHQIRIAPYKEDLEMPFRELWFHFRIGGRTFLCPNKMKGEPDPICDFATTCWNEYTKTNDESFKEMFKTMAPTLRVYVPIVVRGQEDKGIRWWSISPRTTYKEVLNHVRSGLRQNVDITDPSEGLDLMVTVEPGFNGWLMPTTITTALKPTPLAGSKGDIETIIDSVTPVDTLFDYSPAEEMKIALDKHINPNADDSDSSAGSTRDFGNGSTTTVAAEEDKTSKKIDAAFDGLLGGKDKDIDFK